VHICCAVFFSEAYQFKKHEFYGGPNFCLMLRLSFEAGYTNAVAIEILFKEP